MSYIIRVRVKERIIAPPGHVIGQGSGPGPAVVTRGGGGKTLSTKKLIGAGVSNFKNRCVEYVFACFSGSRRSPELRIGGNLAEKRDLELEVPPQYHVGSSR